MYEFRVDFADETTEVVSVPALSIAEAVETIRRDPEVVGTTLLAFVDDEPQRFLAW